MKRNGFTLIEILLALAVIAISLTALLKASSQDVLFTQRVKEKATRHWVALQAIALIQTGLVRSTELQSTHQTITMFGEQWYWRAKISPTSIRLMQKMEISVSNDPKGPFRDPLIAFRYANENI